MSNILKGIRKTQSVVAESKVQLDEIDPRNFDSDEDYYDAIEDDELDLSKFGGDWDIPDEIAVLTNQLRHTTSQYARDQIKRKIARYEQIYYGDDDLEEELSEEQLDELKCWPGYSRVRGVPAGAPGSCKKKTSENIEKSLEEEWSEKYKRSINCSNPKGFSQKAHCAGRKKNEDIVEYGDTAKGQKMLTKVQKRAVDRVTSKKADTDPKYAKKNSDTANRAWDRMSDKDLEEGWKDTATLLGIPAVAGALAVGAQHYDDQQPRVQIGDKSVRYIANPGWGRVPDNAMTLTGKDGKQYRVWKTSGKGGGHVWLAAPAEEVKEGTYTKTPSGDYINQHTGVRSSKPPVTKKKRNEKTGAEWDAIEKAKKDKEQGVAEGSLNEFAPPDSGDDRNYEYEVYQCNPNDQFDWIGGPIYKSDDMGKVHSIAYNLHKKHPDKAFMIWQERSQGSRGGYGIKDDEQGVAEGLNEFAIDKNNDGDGRSKLIGSIMQLLKVGKKVDFFVPGIRGHVVGSGGNGDWLTLKRWNKPHSKINYSLDLDSSDDDRFVLKMIKPDYYQVVEKQDLNQGVAEGAGSNYYSIALQMYPHLKQVDRATVITALNNAYEDYLMHYGYEGIGPDEERSMIDRAIKGLKQGVAEAGEVQSNIDTTDPKFNHLLYMLRYDYPVPRGRLLNKVMMNGEWLDPDDIRDLVKKNKLWANLGFGQEGYNARGMGPGEGGHVVAEGKMAAISRGRRDGKQGKPLAPPYHKDSSDYQEYEKGWNEYDDIRKKHNLAPYNKQGVAEEKCPHCGGAMFSEMIMNEKKDACYYKVKSRYKVWPSAYASGALVKCRKKGASNWGNKSESALNEFAPDNGGEEDNLRKYAKIWYNGNDITRLKVEQILDGMGWEIGPLESEEGGCFVVQAGDEDGDTYIGFTPEELSEQLDENLRQWFKEKWVRFGPDGKIRGACARGDDSEGKPKCLPQSKAHSLGKKGRASAAARKRREDPNPERSGKAINVNTKKKTNETKEADYGPAYQDMVTRVGQKAKEQEKKKPVDIQALARRLNQPEKKSNILKGIEENLGTPYPSTYEEENKPFMKKGSYRITAMTSESKK